jgi:hypothetical protein
LLEFQVGGSSALRASHSFTAQRVERQAADGSKRVLKELPTRGTHGDISEGRIFDEHILEYSSD